MTNRTDVLVKLIVYYSQIYRVKSFTTLMTTRLIKTKDIADAVNELSIDA